MNQILKQKNFNIGFFTKIINFINAKRKFTAVWGGVLYTCACARVHDTLYI